MTAVRSALGLLLVCVGALLATAPSALAAPSYVALGDSYSSGVGTRTYYSNSGSCDRSPDAYGPLIAAADGYALNFQACGGATTADVISSQLGALNGSTSLVTITIGGNDAGFSTVMEDCAGWYFNCQSAINTADSYIENTLPGALNTTYADIRSDAPNAKLVVLDYPHLFTASGATCNFDALTSSHEEELNTTADDLDGVIKTAAASHGFTVVDPRSAFESHEICSSSEWLNGLSNPLSESFHPNIQGQAEFASLIEGVL
ncbi:MAG TPA: SGNH/GDSL hydrolase family protein [Solirubrobacteraceae bacterium]|jgi:lysophospholipase L1-like esterase|nr:SGNH/GDSL hydrolase family protein [Solirubrobacteraceae bacterium]